MVNTFLICSDFRLSASRLDYRRLGKQRVEAYQILQTIEQYRLIAQIFNLPLFPDGVEIPREERRAWVRRVVDTFKQSEFSGIHIRGRFLVFYSKGTPLPRRPASGNTLQEYPGGMICEMKGKKIVTNGQWSQFVLPGEILLLPTIRVHPVIEMWLGFEDALKDYINAHIEAWIMRGYKNTMKTYEVRPHKRPSWCDDTKIHLNFKSALLQKELERNEKSWYILQNEFIEAWAYSPEQVRYLISSGCSREQLLVLGSFPGYLWA